MRSQMDGKCANGYAPLHAWINELVSMQYLSFVIEAAIRKWTVSELLREREKFSSMRPFTQ